MKPVFTCIYTLEELPVLSKKVITFILSQHIHIVLLYGHVGAGKTSFFQAIMNELSPNTIVSSPTYAYLNQYTTKEKKIWHFDLYRIKNEIELVDLGLVDYFSRNDGISFIEWPENAEGTLEQYKDKLILQFHHTEKETQRALTIYQENIS
jgi:tRNA threonylcarbamoyladenosine biosynthesis protein TsaE